MNGFLRYFLSALDPMSNLGFSRAFPKLMTSALPSWWLEVVLPVALAVSPAIIVWLAYLVKPALVRPLLLARPGQAGTFGVGGYRRAKRVGHHRAVHSRGVAMRLFEPGIIFVDDNSTDDSVAVARRAILSVTRNRRDTERVQIFPSPRRNGKASTSTSAFAWRGANSLCHSRR